MFIHIAHQDRRALPSKTEPLTAAAASISPCFPGTNSLGPNHRCSCDITPSRRDGLLVRRVHSGRKFMKATTASIEVFLTLSRRICSMRTRVTSSCSHGVVTRKGIHRKPPLAHHGCQGPRGAVRKRTHAMHSHRGEYVWPTGCGIILGTPYCGHRPRTTIEAEL
jgi:hypothetical protein